MRLLNLMREQLKQQLKQQHKKGAAALVAYFRKNLDTYNLNVLQIKSHSPPQKILESLKFNEGSLLNSNKKQNDKLS